MINRFALSFLCIELDRTRNVRGHRTLYTTHRQIFTGRRNDFRTSLKKARSEHYLSEIQKSGGTCVRPTRY